MSVQVNLWPGSKFFFLFGMHFFSPKELWLWNLMPKCSGFWREGSRSALPIPWTLEFPFQRVASDVHWLNRPLLLHEKAIWDMICLRRLGIFFQGLSHPLLQWGEYINCTWIHIFKPNSRPDTWVLGLHSYVNTLCKSYHLVHLIGIQYFTTFNKPLSCHHWGGHNYKGVSKSFCPRYIWNQNSVS